MSSRQERRARPRLMMGDAADRRRGMQVLRDGQHALRVLDD